MVLVLKNLLLTWRCKRCGFDPWVGKIPWRRTQQPPPVFLPGESPGTEEPGRLQSIGLQRFGQGWSDFACTLLVKKEKNQCFLPFCQCQLPWQIIPQINLISYYFLYFPEEKTGSPKYEAKLHVRGHSAWKQLILALGSSVSDSTLQTLFHSKEKTSAPSPLRKFTVWCWDSKQRWSNSIWEWGVQLKCHEFRGCQSNCCGLIAKSCPTLWDPTDCSPPGSSVHGISQTRILEWVAISFSRESSRPMG